MVHTGLITSCRYWGTAVGLEASLRKNGVHRVPARTTTNNRFAVTTNHDYGGTGTGSKDERNNIIIGDSYWLNIVIGDSCWLLKERVHHVDPRDSAWTPCSPLPKGTRLLLKQGALNLEVFH